MNSLQGKRWFIWTLVFLVVAGVALVAYIQFSDGPLQDSTLMLIHRPKATQTQSQTTKTTTKTGSTQKK